MRALSYLSSGVLLFLVCVIGPMVYFRFTTDPRDPDTAEIETVCFAIPLVILSFLLILIGVMRLVHERSGKKQSSISPPE
jgi:uncharacterized Tic20 family protein